LAIPETEVNPDFQNRGAETARRRPVAGLAGRTARSGALPRWEFDKPGRVMAGMEEVLEILNQDDRLDA